MHEPDQVAIQDVARRWEEAWNRHDMAAMATLLAADADFVNVAGRHWKGRDEIEREHAQRHQARFRESIWTTNDVAIQFLTTDLARPHRVDDLARSGPRRHGAAAERWGILMAHGQRRQCVANPIRAQYERGGHPNSSAIGASLVPPSSAVERTAGSHFAPFLDGKHCGRPADGLS
jgi:uncharacterized protein (TIGR02246 family)